ncbi:hypothetical protein D3C84_713240 [compost metagenome]
MGIELLVQLTACIEERLAAQVTMGHDFPLMQQFETAQCAFDLFEPLVQYILADAQHFARITGNERNLGEMAHHEIGFLFAQRCQGLAHLSGGGHQGGFLAGARHGLVWIAQNEEFTGLEAVAKARIELLEPTGQARRGVGGKLVQDLLTRHALRHDVEAGLLKFCAIECR